MINHWLWRRSISLHREPGGGTWGGGAPVAGTLRDFHFDIHFWVPFLDPEVIANLSYGTEEGTSVHGL